MRYLAAVMMTLWAFAGPAKAEVYQKIAAKVGSEIVTSYDVDEAMEYLKSQMSPEEAVSAEGRKKLEEARKSQLEGLIQQKLVIQEARKWDADNKGGDGKSVGKTNPYLPRGDEVDEAVEKEYDRFEAGFPSPEVFRRELESEHLSEEAFKARLRDKIQALLIYQRVVKAKEKEFQGSFVVGDSEAKKYYAEHQDQFAAGDQVELRDILLADEAKARDIKKRVQAGENFADLAKRYSKDAAASKGGMLGWIEKGQLKWPALEGAAFKAKVGEVSGPIKTSRGWELILVEDTHSAAQKDFESVKSQVMNVLYGQKMKERIEEWVKELRSKTYVEIIP